MNRRFPSPSNPVSPNRPLFDSAQRETMEVPARVQALLTEAT
jgi:hypothetical protein